MTTGFRNRSKGKRRREITENEIKSNETGRDMKTDAHPLLGWPHALSMDVYAVVASLYRANLHYSCMPGTAPIPIRGTPSDPTQFRY
jgi:hypothetical protein